MKETEIIEGNRLIAEFMGFVNHERAAPMYRHKHWRAEIPIFEGWYDNKDLKFHGLWDWLMPVVEKINTMAIDNYGPIGVWISPGKCSIGMNEHDTIKSHEGSGALITLVWMTVVAFIQHLNNPLSAG